MYNWADGYRTNRCTDEGLGECDVLTLLLRRIDFPPQQSVFEVVFWAVQVRV